MTLNDEDVALRFAAFLRQARKARNLTLEQLSEKSGISTSHVWNLESAAKTKEGRPIRPTRDMVMRLAQALNVPLDEALIAAGFVPDDRLEHLDQLPELSRIYICELSSDARQELLRYAHYLREREKSVA